MIPAKIIEISDKVLVEYLTLFKDGYGGLITIIAEVENVILSKNKCCSVIIEKRWNVKVEVVKNKLLLNQQVFIEPTTEGKAKIMKL